MADKKLRVHTLSKDLGVTSKAILAKCHDEGVEGITNHMSTVSAGLAETIRQWFSEDGGSHTAVETATPVDLKKVRKKARRRKPAEEAPSDESAVKAETAPAEAVAGDAAAPAVEGEPIAVPAEPEAPVEAPAPDVAAVSAEDVTAVVAPGSEVSAPTETETPEPAVEDAGQAAATVADVPPVDASGGDESVAEPSAPVEPPAPAGPQNVPAPAQMKGPKVIGFAKPDPVMKPPSRPSQPRGPLRPGGAPPQPGEPDAGSVKRFGGTPGAPAGPGRAKDKDKRGRTRFNPRRSTHSLREAGERLQEWNERDLLERQERLAAAGGRGTHARRAEDKAVGHVPHIAARKTQATVTEPIIMHQLTAATGVSMNDLFYKFREQGVVAARNTIIPRDIAESVLLDFGVELEVLKPKSLLEQLEESYAALERKNLKPRPPVVTMLGHVDHGKTSLLDAIRTTSVADGEAGGITQHIGAYRVNRGDLSVTFLDTPGHAAFTAMRARGANMTDVVVLLVAADDGVMPQTIEAINHAKAANSHIVVALNKIDLPGVDLNKAYGQLAEHDLTPAEWGGEVDVVKTSAITGEGIDELVAHLATMSELLDLHADATIPASGTVVEAEMQQGRGPTARVLIREGKLKKGDFVVCGIGSGRVRFLKDDHGKVVKSAGPGVPVEVGGLDQVPGAGDKLYVVKSLQEAKQIAEEAQELKRQAEFDRKAAKPMTLADLLSGKGNEEIPELNLILRSDVHGSIDALMKSLGEIPSEDVKLNFLHTGIGSISESDVVLAEASGALIVGFNVSVDGGAQKLAQEHGVDIRLYRIIYNLIDDIRAALEGLLPTIKTEETRGKATVREIFNVSKVGTIAGCLVDEGVIQRSNKIRVIRDGQIIVPTKDDVKRERHRGIESLRRFKDDAKEVRSGMECGIHVEGFSDLKPGDVLEAYEVIETAQKL